MTAGRAFLPRVGVRITLTASSLGVVGMDFDAVVVGSGLVGAGLALALKHAGLKLALVEAQPPRAPQAGWDSRVYAISPGSAAFLEESGAWQKLDPTRVTRVEDMRIFGDDSSSELDFSAYDSGLRELAFIVEQGQLHNAVWQGLQQDPRITLFTPAICDTLLIGRDTAELQLRDGRRLRSALVVGADGADSWVRAQAGIHVETRPYRQLGVVANFSTSMPHRDTAFQWFRSDGVLALLPLPGNRVSMVWSLAQSAAERLLALSPADLAAEVELASGSMLGAMEVITSPAAFPLRLQRVRHLVQPRVALVGDAAHNVHPLAGQGVNLGLRDARELARTLAARGVNGDCGDFYLLRRYERARREDILALQLTTDALHKLFSDKAGWLGRVRNLGLRLTNRQSGLKNLLVQHAVG